MAEEIKFEQSNLFDDDTDTTPVNEEFCGLEQKIALNDSLLAAGAMSSKVTPFVVKSVTNTIETIVSKDLDLELEKLTDIDPSLWKIDAFNLSKLLLYRYQNDIEQNLKEKLVKEGKNWFPPPDREELCCNSLDARNTAVNYYNETKKLVVESEACCDFYMKIGSDNPTDIRLKYLNIFMQIQTYDDIDHESWVVIFNKLKKNLTDNNLEVFNVTSQIHLKLAANGSPFFLRESFQNLVETLYLQYYFKKFPNLEISMNDETSFRIVTTLLAILEILKYAEQNASRFNEKSLLELLSSFLGLIFLHPFNITDIKQIYNLETLSPYSFLCSLDPTSSWLNTILFNAKTRSIVLNILRENTKFLQSTFSFIYNWFQQSEIIIPLQGEYMSISCGSVKLMSIKYAMLIHSISLLSNVCDHTNGKELLLKVLSFSELFSYSSFLGTLINFLHNYEIIKEAKDVRFSERFIELIITTIVKMVPEDSSEISILLFKELFVSFCDSQPTSLASLKLLKKLLDKPGFVNFIISESGGYYFSRDQLIKTPDSAPRNSSRSKRSSTCSESRSCRKSEKVSEVIENNIVLKIIHLGEKHLQKTEKRSIPKIIQLLKIMIKFYATPNMLVLISTYDCAVLTYTLRLIENYSENLDKIIEVTNNTPEIDALYSALQELIFIYLCSPLGQSLMVKESILTRISASKLKMSHFNLWNEPQLNLFIAFSITSEENLQILIKNDYFICGPTQELLQTGVSFSHNPKKSTKEVYLTFMNAVFTLSFSSAAVKKLLSQVLNSDPVDSILPLEDKIQYHCFLLIITYNLMNSVDNQNMFYFIALKALKVLSQNLNSCINLVLKLNLQEKLAEDQISVVSPRKSKEIIIDECSLLRDELIQLAQCPGIYHCNKTLLLTQTQSEFSPPSQKLRTAVHRKRQLNSISKFLFETKNGLHDLSWLRLLRKSFQKSVKDEIKSTVILELMKSVAKCSAYLMSNCNEFLQVERALNSKPSQFEELAIKFTLRFGEKNNLLHATKANEDNLFQLTEHCKGFFSTNESETFDWFLATVFLICSGSLEKSLQTLSTLSALPSVPYVWSQLGQKKNQAWFMMGQLMEWLLYTELFHVYSIFKLKGFSWWLIYKSWMQQCFWNQLQWNNIALWTLLVILYPVDYQIYFSISILNHSQDLIIESYQNDDFLEVLPTLMHNYHLHSQMDYILYLHRKYSSYILRNIHKGSEV